jgi:pilus assembly protein CpaE
MSRVVIAVADQVIVQELRSRLDQSDVSVEVVSIAESTQEMVSAILAHRPAMAFVHDQLGPGPVMQLVRDLTLRNPALAVLVVTTGNTAETFDAALNAGARGVLTHPFGLEDLNHRLSSLLEWNQTIRAALNDHAGANGSRDNRGARVIAVAGAKGGVGTTVIASHLAWDAARSDRQMRVCLVDLDVESGDVPSYLDVSHRVSIADLAKISEDLTARAVSDTVVVHSSGLHLLLAPGEIRDTEFITPEAVRRIIAQLRALYHLVVIDVGSAITTTQAAAVESADMTLQLVTADVPALRAARRQVVAWESLGVTSADAVHVVVNRFVRRSEIQQDTVDMLTLGQRSQILIPDLDRALERAGNSRTPSEVKNQTWWKSLRAIGAELDLSSAFREAVATAARMESVDTQTAMSGAAASAGSSNTAAANGLPAKGHSRSAGRAAKTPRGRSARRVAVDSGQATLETVAMFPFALLILAICLQTILLGVSYAYSGVAADAAARAVSIGTNPQLAVAEALPAGLHSKVSVSSAGSSVRVTVRAPLLVGDGVTRDVGIVVNHRVVEEPR